MKAMFTKNIKFNRLSVISVGESAFRNIHSAVLFVFTICPRS